MATPQETRSPAEIESDIERTRNEMADTLSKLQHKLSPAQWVEEALGFLQEQDTKRFGQNLGDVVKENPLPVTLVGLGLAWLMMSGTGGASTSTGPAAAGLGARLGAKADEVRHGVGDVIGSAREKSGEIAAQVVDRAERAGDRIQGQFRQLLREQPLVLAAFGIAVGAVLGACLPRVGREEQMSGATRDRPAPHTHDTHPDQPAPGAVYGPLTNRRHGAGERRQALHGAPPTITDRRRGPIERRGLSASAFLSM